MDLPVSGVFETPERSLLTRAADVVLVVDDGDRACAERLAGFREGLRQSPRDEKAPELTIVHCADNVAAEASNQLQDALLKYDEAGLVAEDGRGNADDGGEYDGWGVTTGIRISW